jgi:hypothetical protein
MHTAGTRLGDGRGVSFVFAQGSQLSQLRFGLEVNADKSAGDASPML